MSSFIQTTEQATTEMQDISKKILSQLKTYCFFLFYQLKENEKNSTTILEKINFSLNQQKSVTQINTKTRQVQLNLYNINNHTDMLHAISDIRSHSFQNKAKIILNASEEKLGYLLEEFQKMKVDISSIPIMINSNQFQSDISRFLGWKNWSKDSMAIQGLPFYQHSSQEWIKSSTQKIDVWRVQLSVSKQTGQISKLINNKLSPLEDKKHLKQYFISNFCVGYHASMLLNCKQKITTNDDSLGNSFITMIERFKKFCCVGDKSMKSATGIVNITLVDQNGQEIQLLKHLKPGDSQQQSQADFKSSKYKQYNNVLSILLANINIYQDSLLQQNIQGKVNDGKIQLIMFDSQKSHRKVCSSSGEIRMKMDAQSVDVQVGETFYRLKNPEEIKITLAKKIKIGIHNQMVKC